MTPTLIASVVLAPEVILSVDVYETGDIINTATGAGLSPDSWRVYVAGEEVGPSDCSEWLADRITEGLRGELWEQVLVQWREFEGNEVVA